MQQEGVKQLENKEQGDIGSSLLLGSFLEQDTEIFGGIDKKRKAKRPEYGTLKIQKRQKQPE